MTHVAYYLPSALFLPLFPSSPLQQLRQVWLFPFLYAFSMLGVCVFFTTAYQVQKRLLSKKSFDLEDNFSGDIHRKQFLSLSLSSLLIHPILMNGFLFPFTDKVVTVEMMKSQF